MQFGTDLLTELTVPDGTTVREHDVVTEGDVIVGGRATVGHGVRGRNVLAGEGVRFGGDVEAERDCRLDMWTTAEGNVLAGEDAYVGERVEIDGRLMVSGDLDIGDDVEVGEGFEANGWIVIRNPMPTVVFVFVYLSQLLRIGADEAAERLVEELTDESDVDDAPLVIPRNATVSDDVWRVSTPASIGDDCRLHGNVRAAEIEVGEATEIFGSLRATGDVTVGSDTVVHGDVTTRDGAVSLAPEARVRGDVSCGSLSIDDGAAVDGTMRANDEVRMSHGDADSGA